MLKNAHSDTVRVLLIGMREGSRSSALVVQALSDFKVEFATPAALEEDEALTALGSCDVVLLDAQSLPSATRSELVPSTLQHVLEKDPRLRVVALVGSDPETARLAASCGAWDIVEAGAKEVEERLRAAAALRRLQAEAAETGRGPVSRVDTAGAEQPVDADEEPREMVGTSAPMRRIFSLIRRVAATDVPVLITGESGTGKELTALAIHDRSLRAEAPFVAINCAAIPESLLESELFGHRRGAFTGAVEERKGRFEQAGGGTMFLDEVGDIPLPTQVKLLRVLQERKFERLGENRTISVDVRIIAATNADLEKLVEEGRFREDLFYRLNVIPLYLPPLRDRRDDIIPLAEHFLERFNQEYGKGVSFTPEALDLLVEYRWPGNVRELENLVERTVVMAKAPVVGAQDLPRTVRLAALPGVPDGQRPPQGPAAPAPPVHGDNRFAAPPRADHLRALEREELEKALESTGWVIARAAKILGWTPRQVAYKMMKHSLKSPWK